jgi:hypothetical protein
MVDTHMKLLHLKYDKNGNSKHLVLLYLYENETKLIGLDETSIPIDQINLIRSNVEQINKMTPEEMAEWMKGNIPAYRTAYRTLIKDNTTILKEYEITPTQVKPMEKPHEDQRLDKVIAG